MENVGFPDAVEADEALGFAVVYARHGGKWVFVRHRERTTWEMPGGHREPSETVEAAAHRELWEETGATDYQMWPVGLYSVQRGPSLTFGALYFAQIWTLGPLPDSEIAEVGFFDDLPANLTHPRIQPPLHQKILGYLSARPLPPEIREQVVLCFETCFCHELVVEDFLTAAGVPPLVVAIGRGPRFGPWIRRVLEALEGRELGPEIARQVVIALCRLRRLPDRGVALSYAAYNTVSALRREAITAGLFHDSAQTGPSFLKPPTTWGGKPLLGRLSDQAGLASSPKGG